MQLAFCSQTSPVRVSETTPAVLVTKRGSGQATPACSHANPIKEGVRYLLPGHVLMPEPVKLLLIDAEQVFV